MSSNTGWAAFSDEQVNSLVRIFSKNCTQTNVGIHAIIRLDIAYTYINDPTMLPAQYKGIVDSKLVLLDNVNEGELLALQKGILRTIWPDVMEIKTTNAYISFRANNVQCSFYAKDEFLRFQANFKVSGSKPSDEADLDYIYDILQSLHHRLTALERSRRADA